MQPSSQCGQPGEFIQIPTMYMLGPVTTIVREFGFPGPTIVHEWGHLRWGLRDEYPVDDYPWFYHDSDHEVTAVKCGKYMKGSHVDYHTKKECTINSTTKLPTRTCYFKPDNNPGVEASLMFYHNVTGVSTFCDNDPNNPDTLHNDEAPNIHNYLCNGRSAWEIMRDHEDFRNGNSPAIDISQKADPTFRIVQATNRRIVVLMDVSGSMAEEVYSGVTRLQRLRQTVAELLLKYIPKGYSVGLVAFNESTSIVAPLTEITSMSVREQLVDKLPQNTPGGETSIGIALQECVLVLEDNGGSASGGIVILVSDGEETGDLKISDVTPDLVRKGVIVDTIQVAIEHAVEMTQLAADTNGKSFYDSGSSESTDLLSALKSSIAGDDSAAPGDARIELSLASFKLEAREVATSSVAFDSSIGRDTEFTFLYTGSSFKLDVVVTSPSGHNYSSNGPNSRHNDVTKQLTISPGEVTEVGRWKVVVTNPRSESVFTQHRVTSRPRTNDTYPIKLATFISNQHLDYDVESTLKVIVTADVQQGYAPIIGANVEVQIGSLGWKQMKDDGIGVDVVRGDGYYSAFLFNFTSDGTYRVRVRATAAQDTARLLTGGGSRAFSLPSALNGNALGPTYDTLEAFERTAAAGLIQVSNRAKHPDLNVPYPFDPTRVTDLKVTEISYEEKTVTLQWTSVGDFVEQETASSYDIRYSTDIKVMRHYFENAPQLGESDVIFGGLNSPANAFEQETFVIRFPAAYEDKTLFFGLKVNHGASRISDVSNVVSAALAYIPPATTAAPRGPSSGTSILLYIVGGVVILVMLLVMAAVWVFCRRKFQNSGYV
ncbi:Calcium-activated chloride channel regulator 3A-1 [Lamellibrachia satsuma]|nr:Calcium-activated chloride channel regulator 3A-1 [Lamellibrachia satsuma]